MRKIIGILLTSVMILGVLSGCSTKKDPEPTPVPTSTEKVYVYGIAGDMFREFVNEVSGQRMDNVMKYVALDENAIVSQDDVKRYLMSQKIGNLIAMDYSTKNVVLAEEGDIRDVRFYYYLGDSTESDYFTMKVKLVGTEWMVNLDEMTTRFAKLKLPQGVYNEIDIDGHKIDVSKFEIDEEGYQVYSLPQISEYEHDVKITNSNGSIYEGVMTWTYVKSKNGKVTDDAVRTINAENFIVPQTTPVPEETQDVIDKNNENDEDINDGKDIPPVTNPVDDGTVVTSPENDVSPEVSSEIIIPNPSVTTN